MESTFIHSKSDVVTRTDLLDVPDTKPMGRFHKPVHHYDLINKVESGLWVWGFRIDREEFALSKDMSKLFGVLGLERCRPGKLSSTATHHISGGVDTGLSMGIRSANDQSFSIQMIVGLRVFVCDNLCFSGDVLALSRKHTTKVNLEQEIENGLQLYFSQEKALRNGVERLENTPLPMYLAKELMYDAFVNDVLPARFLKPVDKAYFRPNDSWTDCHPNTSWGLHNAMTRAIKDEPIRSRMSHSVKIGKHFGLGS